ncbi:hypothetical protein Scep_014503 [Stephania cephalantha]|uniref:Uncharacterized protein n=1 Tax=Stephania cephalantha TaxID=152367 RepID=A0AAP0J3F8_9MAGN
MVSRLWYMRFQEDNDEVEVLVNEKIEKVVMRLMDKSSEECEEMRRRVEEIGEMGRKAIEEGRSSRLNLS